MKKVSLGLISFITLVGCSTPQKIPPLESMMPQDKASIPSTADSKNTETSPQDATSALPSAPAIQAPTSPPPIVPSALPPETVSQITELSLSFEKRIFSGSGQSVTLTVKDQEGQVLQVENLVFSSSRPQDINVSELGVVKAIVDEGFSTIKVKVLGSDISKEQLFSVSTPSGGSGGSSSTSGNNDPTTEKVEGQIEFEG